VLIFTGSKSWSYGLTTGSCRHAIWPSGFFYGCHTSHRVLLRPNKPFQWANREDTDFNKERQTEELVYFKVPPRRSSSTRQLLRP
jgi:hypothetical protein